MGYSLEQYGRIQSLDAVVKVAVSRRYTPASPFVAVLASSGTSLSECYHCASSRKGVV